MLARNNEWPVLDEYFKFIHPNTTIGIINNKIEYNGTSISIFLMTLKTIKSNLERLFFGNLSFFLILGLFTFLKEPRDFLGDEAFPFLNLKILIIS